MTTSERNRRSISRMFTRNSQRHINEDESDTATPTEPQFTLEAKKVRL